MASELAEAISEAIDSTSNHAELIDRVIAENGEVSCIYCSNLSFKGLTLENGRWSSVASKAMADHMLSCPGRPEAKLTAQVIEAQERIRTLESACEAALNWIKASTKDVAHLDHDQPTHCADCDLRHKSKKLVEQLEGAIKNG